MQIPPKLNNTEIIVALCFFLFSLSSFAQNSLQSGAPNWLPNIALQDKQNQPFGVSTTLDTDGDGISDINDLDDDNDGILDTVECNCTDPNFFIPPYSAGGITKEGPAANQTGTNVMDAGDHGWISLNETLSAGERLVLDNAFLENLLNKMRESGDNSNTTGIAGALLYSSSNEFYLGFS